MITVSMVIRNVVTRGRKFVTSGEPKTQSEAQRRGRGIATTDAFMAVAFLNLKKTRAVKRVLLLRQHLQQLEDVEAEILTGRAEGMDALQLQSRYIGILQAVNTRLASCTFTPMLACLSFETYERRFQMGPKKVRGPVVSVSDGGPRPAEVDETTAIAALARLFARRELRQVHLCDNCNACWHVAERSIDRFCSDKCREVFHTKSPSYAAKRREIQRTYRANVKRKILLEDEKRKG